MRKSFQKYLFIVPPDIPVQDHSLILYYNLGMWSRLEIPSASC